MKHSKHVWTRVLIAAPLALSFAAHADSVDVQVRSSDRVSGTIRPTYDQECFVCEVAQNTVVSAVVKGRSKTGPAFKLAMRQNMVDVPGAAFTTRALGGTLKAPAAVSSGQYQVCVFVDDGKDGDYDLVVTWKPQLTWTSTGGPMAVAGADSFTFSAPEGSSATIDLLPGKGSKFKGDLVELTGPDGFEFDLSDEVQKRFVAPFLPATGEYTVHLTNVGEAGTWTGRVKLRVPKFKLRKFDLRDSALGGAFASDHTVIGREVDEAGGEVVVQTSGASLLDGASVLIPADSLSGPVVITISGGTDIDVGDEGHTSGPAVEFGPSGTEFDPTKSAQITIPFDPAYFPGGDTSSLVIYVRAADGTITQVPPPYVFNGNTVTFSTSHFSTYQAATSNPRPFEGSFVAVSAGGDLFGNYEGNFGFGLHRVSAIGPRADIQNSEARIEWRNFGVEGSGAGLIEDFSFQALTAAVVNDNTVQLTDPQQQPAETVTFVRGVSDDVLVARDQCVVLLRRAAGRATPATLAGAWRIFHMEFKSSVGQQFPSDVNFELLSETGTVTFTTDGRLLLGTFREVESQSKYQVGTWTTLAKNQAGPTGVTYSFDDEGGVKIHPPGDESSFKLDAVLDGNVLVGLEFSGNGESPESSTGLFVFVRNTSGLTTAKIAGDFFFSQHATQVVDNPAAEEPPKAQDFAFGVSDFVSKVAANGAVTAQGTRDLKSRDDKGTVFTVDDQSFTRTGRLVTKADGGIVSADLSFTGAVAIGGGFVVFMNPAPSGSHEIAFGVRVVPKGD